MKGHCYCEESSLDDGDRSPSPGEDSSAGEAGAGEEATGGCPGLGEARLDGAGEGAALVGTPTFTRLRAWRSISRSIGPPRAREIWVGSPAVLWVMPTVTNSSFFV